ncbi:protein kinase domain-containing protein [Nannocystaceae bacterium ST9]
MTILPGFEPGPLIHAGSRSRILRARRVRDGIPVVLKTHASGRPSAQAVDRLRREWEIGRCFDHPNIIRYLGLEVGDESAAIVMEDFHGVSLAERIPVRGFAIDRFLDLSMQLVRGLAAIHARRVVHKDVKPRNILIDASGQQVKYIDFGVSAQLDLGERLTVAPNRLEGTLAYISPEQTGRMNRALDHRADLYSLGVTFYELLCGQVPFSATEALELVHCHLAKIPDSPASVRPEVPEQLARIVGKLLAKAPEDRYQSARGLLYDLTRCRDALLVARSIPLFDLGSHDRGPELRVPGRLFGRERDLDLLERAWMRAQRGRPALVLVSGSSGVGKSSLVAELDHRLRDRAGAFISGKFGQLGSRAAYEGFTEAFRSLAGRILGAGLDEFGQWRAQLGTALAINGRILLDMVPEMEAIVGPLPPVQPLGPEESQHRFNLVFRRFVRACAREDHPLTLFLDDLQWADPGSLALLELLARDEEQTHLLLIASVRDDEIDAEHPTRATLDAIRRSAGSLVELPLRELGVADVEALIAEALGRTPPRSRELAELVVERTAGNPFFVRTFLQSAWEEKLLVAELPEEGAELEFELGAVAWRWDDEGLRGMQASESVGELLARRLRQLPESARVTLRTAACLGTEFTPETVAAINEASPETTTRDLADAARAGMLLQHGDDRFDFVHDRVREAARALLPPHERAQAHLRIGRMLLANTPDDRLSERIFAIVDHLDTGRPLIRESSELVELAKLAMIAGRRAHGATAYATAVRYYRTGLECLEALGDHFEAWTQHYALTRDLHRELAIAEYLTDDVESSRRHIGEALEHAHEAADRVELLDLLVFQHTMATRYAEALETGREALALLDIPLPTRADELDRALAIELAEYRERVARRSIASLIDLPMMTRRDTRAGARLLSTMISAAFSADHRLFPLVSLKLVNLSLAHGHVPESCYGYAHHGTFVGSALGDHATAHEWGLLALALARKLDDLAQECRACNIVAGFLLPWRAHVRECEPLNLRGHQIGTESGQLEFVGYIEYHRQLLALFAGTSLAKLHADLARALGELQQINHVYAANVVRGVQLIVAGLLGERLQGQPRELAMLEREFVATCRADQSFIAICVHYVYQAQLRYLHGDVHAALEAIAQSKEFLPYAIGHVALADRNFYHSLALIRVLGELSTQQQQLALATIEHNQAQMQQWARSCPANFEHKRLLVAAELARADGELLAALELYEQAIAAAGLHGFVQVHALANELAARMWVTQGNRRLALPYLSEAVASWRTWGARRKLRLLELEFPELVRDLPGVGPRRQPMAATSEGGNSSQALDLATVTRASQAISSEIDLDRLLARMMRIILLNAGANRGFLILEAEEDFRIEAAASSEGSEVELDRKRSLQDADLAVSIVRHVLRSGENVVLEDAHRNSAFSSDPHVVRRRLKSVLCTPIRHKDELVGVLYLENEHAAAAFTEARTEVLQILLSQAAISLENARFYNELKTLNAELRVRADELAISKSRLEAEIAERERGQAERQQLEAQLRQSQKMEAIGQLAGGVAHDFNNLLTTIIGSTDVLQSQRKEELGRAGVTEIRVIREAAERGAALTRQLLAFSRRQVLQPEIIDLNALVSRSGKILERLLGAEYQLRSRLGERIGRVRVDPGQLEQVLLNLVINARDAMTPGGTVTIATREQSVNAQINAVPQVVKPGEWVVLSVVDDGAGMDRRTLAHIFEPFFTTKGVGEGTGLGLSTVLGIVQQSDGMITVDSKVGVGTTFEIWLPRFAGGADLPRHDSTSETDDPGTSGSEGHATILVVEDEAPVRRTVEQILKLHGYNVLTAENGEACLELCAGFKGLINLVLTDFVMPKLGGLELALRLRKLRPETKILFMSGFTDGELASDKVAELGGIELIEKPFRAAALLERIRTILG